MPAKKKTATKREDAKPRQALPGGVSKYQRFLIERVPRTALKGAPYNPRIIDKHTRKRLQDALRRNGLIQPIVWNKRTGYIVGGHQRLVCLDALEGSDNYNLDVAVVDADEQEERALNVSLNNQTLMGDWDLDALESILSEPELDVAATGFARADLALVLDQGVLDGIFGAEASRQATVEQPIIAQLEEVKQSGREADAKDRADDQLEQKRAAEIQKMREGRKAYIEKSKDNNASEIMVVLVADSESEVDQFLVGLELPADQRYIDMRIVADRLEIKLGNEK